MGTMQDELKKVIDTWDSPTLATSTLKEKTVEHKTQTARIIEYIANNPGLSGMQLNALLPKLHPDIKEGNVSSFLKQLCDSHYLKRIDTGNVGARNRPIYEYYAMSDADREQAVEEAKRHKAMVARAAAAREAKAKLAEERRKAKTKAQRKAHTAATPVPTHTPAPEIKTTWSAKAALQGLSVLQARELYDELKDIFGA